MAVPRGRGRRRRAASSGRGRGGARRREQRVGAAAAHAAAGAVRDRRQDRGALAAAAQPVALVARQQQAAGARAARGSAHPPSAGLRGACRAAPVSAPGPPHARPLLPLSPHAARYTGRGEPRLRLCRPGQRADQPLSFRRGPHARAASPTAAESASQRSSTPAKRPACLAAGRLRVQRSALQPPGAGCTRVARRPRASGTRAAPRRLRAPAQALKPSAHGMRELA